MQSGEIDKRPARPWLYNLHIRIFIKPATGKSYELVAMEWFVVRDRHIHRRWGARDAASQVRQLGWNVQLPKKMSAP